MFIAYWWWYKHDVSIVEDEEDNDVIYNRNLNKINLIKRCFL